MPIKQPTPGVQYLPYKTALKVAAFVGTVVPVESVFEQDQVQGAIQDVDIKSEQFDPPTDDTPYSYVALIYGKKINLGLIKQQLGGGDLQSWKRFFGVIFPGDQLAALSAIINLPGLAAAMAPALKVPSFE